MTKPVLFWASLAELQSYWRHRIHTGLVVLWSVAIHSSAWALESGQKVDFHRDIQPIFEAHCYSCHGPEKQRSDLRLDVRAAALQGGSLGPAWVPGDGEGSRLIQFISGNPEDMRMPPKGDPLTPAEIDLVRSWIEGGAYWALLPGEVEEDPILSHWAFRPVQTSEVPAPMELEGVPLPLGPLDYFIDARLSENGLHRSAEADRRTLIRRLYWSLLGLPPSPENVEAFVADPDPDAFEKWVDQLLEDPRYGERWARHWLDVIRFAETNGFETNRERLAAWRFRDYVIQAINQDKPFDQFIREQIAGDTLGADVATGFLVGGPVDIVKSPDPVLTAQQRADELDDMINTIGTTFLGLTLGCARCHNHKFDPISHQEYHAMAALVVGVEHGERAAPLTEVDRQRKLVLEREIRDLEKRLEPYRNIGRSVNVAPGDEALLPGVNARLNEDPLEPVFARAIRFTILATNGGEPCIDELEVWSGDVNVALSENGALATASGSLKGYDIHKLEHVHDGRVGNGRSWISNETGRGWVQLEFPERVQIDRVVWGRDREGRFRDRVAVTYQIEALGESGDWVLVSGSHRREPYKGDVQEPKGPLYDFSRLPSEEAAHGRGWLELRDKKIQELKKLEDGEKIYAGQFTKPQTVYRLHRGDPMQKREPIAPGVLALFEPFELPMDAGEDQRRIRLADWIADPRNPLTARVLVNRVWQYQFGVGFVETPNDFGVNGARPTHPELLDWLAAEFIADGWSLKRLQRRILLSATWRQSSTPDERALQVDAASRLMWRFPPRRLEAEAIRDGILAVSGALDARMGGASFYLHDVDRENVYHYHPKETFGPEEARRMVYAFKVRMEPDAIFGSFDCPDGSLAVPRRSISTTPLQALNLFNSRFLMQQVEHLVQRLHVEADESLESRLQRLWQLAYGRQPEPSEILLAAGFAERHGLDAVCRAVLNSNEFLFLP